MKRIKLFENFSDREQREKERSEKAAEVMKVATPEQKKVIEDFQAGTEYFFLMPLKLGKITPEEIDFQLQVMVNSVEGDKSQLDEEHIKYAEKNGWFEGFE